MASNGKEDGETQTTTKFPDSQEIISERERIQIMRSDLIKIAEKQHNGKIGAYGVNQIKKANSKALIRIKETYERDQLEETNKYLSDVFVSKLTKIMDHFNLIDDPEGMEEELNSDVIVKRDLEEAISQITPYIPYKGAFIGSVIVGEHVYKKYTKSEENVNDNDVSNKK